MSADAPQLLLQVLDITPRTVDWEKARRLRGVVTQMSLLDEKVRFELGGPNNAPHREPESTPRIH